MKKNVCLFCLIVAMTFPCTYAFSAGIYENANQSAEFIRTLTRYASTGIDSAYYNPAGTVMMKDGLYAYLSDQMIFDYQTITDSSLTLSALSEKSKYTGEAMTWSFPDIYVVYKNDNWSAFFSAGLIGRGAAATYNDSIPMINKLLAASGILLPPTDTQLEAYAYFIGMTLGGAYKISDTFSFGGGVRYVHAEQNTKLKYNYTANPADNIDIDVDASGDSAGFIGSLDVKPLTGMNIGLRYEYYTTMKVKNDKPSKSVAPPAVAMNPYFAFITDGYTQKQTLPMNASIGISYLIIPDLTVEGGFIYYFNKQADWGKDSNGDKIAKNYDNGYDASVSIEYAFLPQLKGSIGYSYSVSGVNSKTRNNEQLGLTSNALGLGGTYSFANGIDFTIATMIIFFNSATVTNAAPDTGSTKYTDKVYNVAGSVSYKFM